MSSIILFDQNFNANDLHIMVSEAAAWRGNKTHGPLLVFVFENPRAPYLHNAPVVCNSIEKFGQKFEISVVILLEEEEEEEEERVIS